MLLLVCVTVTVIFITLSTPFSIYMLALSIGFFCCGCFVFNKDSEILIWVIVRHIETFMCFT